MPAQPFSVNDLYNLYRTYQQGSVAGDESFNPAANGPGYMTEADFNALPEAQRMELAGQYSTGGTNVYQDEQGNLVGHGDPRFIEQGGWFDPAGMTTDENGRFTINRDAVNWDALNDIQNATDRSGFFSGTPLQNIMRGAGIVLGVGGMANSGFLDFLPGMEELGSIPVDPMLTESVAPQVTETMLPDPFGPPGLPSVPDVPVDPPLTESIPPQVTEQMVPNPFERPWWRDAFDLGRDLLRGDGQNGPGGGIIAALMGQGGGKIGAHATDNDPYGLIASGYGPWTGLLDKPKDRVVEALARRSRTMGI